ncbi:MAG: L-idonate 5-dehydrogenase [Hyphomicrobiaceae bacterium]
MRAVVIHAPHDLRIDTANVRDPGPGEVEVAIEAGGICGSDLHYYHAGGFGTVRIQQPMVLGHEVAGRVVRVGQGVEAIGVGNRVAVSPSRPCNACSYCLTGHQMHCLDMRFYGSAMRYPHVQGAFQEVLVADAGQCHIVPETLSAGEAAMAEPLAVALHAVRQAGPMLGRRVIITGSGPIGALCALAARRAGALDIVMTDVSDAPAELMMRLGADRFINVAADPNALAAFATDKGTFDCALEASGNQRALVGLLDVVRPKGRIVQVGLGGEMTLPMNTVVAKELELKGTFRFHEEFALAVAALSRGQIDVKPLITATLPFTDAKAAFDLASDRTRAMKVQLAFAG